MNLIDLRNEAVTARARRTEAAHNRSRAFSLATVILLFAPVLALAASVKDFGAKGDGATDDTVAVQTAVDACSAKGETLVFPAGTFMTGMIQLRSNTAIELTVKSIWKGIGRVDAYPVQRPRGFENQMIRAWRAMIYAEDVENISITGHGLIDGDGGHEAFPKRPNNSDRPFGLWVVRARGVRIDGIHLRNSAFWMQNYEGCDHVRITGIRVFNHANVNNDGLDITDCHDVVVSDAEIDSSDDALCLKSHSPRGASDIVISNCILAGHADLFKLGTASVGRFHRVTANNLVLRPSAADHIEHPLKTKGGLSGIDLMSTDGGTLEDVVIQNVVMDGLETPFVIKLGNRWERGRRAGKAADSARKAAAPTPTAGIVRNVMIAHVVARRCGPIPSSITGYPGHSVENIVLSDILLEIDGGAEAHDQPVPENSGNYPFNRIFGRQLPAYGFLVRHAVNVRFRDVQVKTIAPDERRAFIFEDASGALDNIDIANSSQSTRAPMLVDREGAIALRGTSRELRIEVGTLPAQGPREKTAP